MLDWEDAVAAASKPAARAATAAALEAAGEPAARIWIRLNALHTALFEDDLQQLPATRIAGVVLPKACGPRDVQTLGERLAAVERRHGLGEGTLRIVTVASETAASALALTEFRAPLPRLAGMLWGAEDLAADLGALANRDAGRRYRRPFLLARDLVLMAAAATQSLPIDAVQVDFRDLEGLAFECEEARTDGFAAKATIHPMQLETIHAAFSSSEAERAWAQRVCDALAGGGVAVVDGKMVDAPHLRMARRLLGC